MTSKRFSLLFIGLITNVFFSKMIISQEIEHPVFSHDHLIEKWSSQNKKELKKLVGSPDSIYSQDLKKLYNLYQLEILHLFKTEKEEEKGKQ